ncbi:MAG: hypothetical protein ACFE7R_05505 [Candidatus Hodarchaeota archaeon]
MKESEDFLEEVCGRPERGFNYMEDEQPVLADESSESHSARNTLPEKEIAGDEIETEIQIPQSEINEAKIMEDYTPIQELSFEVEEAKDESEKKRKRRNYKEFRFDYKSA